MDGMRRIMCYFEGIHHRQNTSTNELQTNQAIKCINTAGLNKVEIFEGSNCYIRKERFESILRRHGEKKDWKKIITEILVELYGNNLQFYSAKGCKGSLGVYWRLSDAIKDLIKIKLAIPITSKMFSKHINNVCCNRKLKYKGASTSTSRSSTKRSMATSNDSNKLSKRPKKLEFFQPNHTSTPFDETISSELPGAKDFFAQSPASKSSDYSTQSPLHDHQVNIQSRIESPGYRPQPPPTTTSTYSTQPPSSENPGYRPQPPPTTTSTYSTQPPSSENPGYRPQPPPTATLSYSSVPARVEHQSYFSQPLGTAAPNYSPISPSVNTISGYCTQSPNDLPPVNWIEPAARENVY
ncbi:mitogen-activated protein kinase 18-like isoform X2 [Cotesia glomerata]|uniref:mitogen-activated protein kinase 18-like isoform X2 n=1 Tax=Cotesia glomerata TaxID=32391 RepID=UPI001D035870|nr:mitogen-activated protein kinase 18-like isoform X2 [Cotesia glomerata]